MTITHPHIFPHKQLEAAQRAAQALLSYFELQDISMGGGTVLQARWQHRQSLDVDFFCKADEFARVHREHGAAVEAAMVTNAGADPERTWMEYMALYCEIHGIEVTLMPHTFILEEDYAGVLPGDVPVGLQTTSEILAKKLRHRLFDAQTVEVRDVYDLACAVTSAPDALDQAKHALSSPQRHAVWSMLSRFPKGWSRQTDKPLIEAADWDEHALIETVQSALHRDA